MKKLLEKYPEHASQMERTGFSLLFWALNKSDAEECWKTILDAKPTNPIFWIMCARNTQFGPYHYLLKKVGQERFIQHCLKDFCIDPGPYADDDFEHGKRELRGAL